MKKIFTLKESDVKFMSKTLVNEWKRYLVKESLLLALAAKLFQKIEESPHEYGVTDFKYIGSDGNLLFYTYMCQFVVNGKIIDVTIYTVNNNHDGYYEYWQKDSVNFYGEEKEAEKLYMKFRKFVYSQDPIKLMEITKKFDHPHQIKIQEIIEFGGSNGKPKELVEQETALS